MIPRWKVRLLWMLTVSSLVLAAIKFVLNPDFLASLAPPLPPGPADAQRSALRRNVYNVLFDHGIQADWISGDSLDKTIGVPKDLPMVVLYTALVASIRELGGQLMQAESNAKGDKTVIEVGLQNEPLFRLTLRSEGSLERVAGRIAIVIPNLGNSYDKLVKEFLRLDEEITFSVIPGLKHARQISLSAAEYEHEVLIQLAVEPTNGKVEGEYSLASQMSKKEIRRRVRKAISAIPNAKGLNDPRGSLAVLDDASLSALLAEIKGAKMTFLEGGTSGKTTAYDLAQKKKIPVGSNDAFLDTIKEEPFIRQQFIHLAEIASRNGQAIGIGSLNKVTLKVLRRELPRLKKKGYRFVELSKIVL